MHTIRLRGPWQYEIGEPSEAVRHLSQPSRHRSGRLTLPGSWSETAGEETSGPLVLRRRFGCPTGIRDGERVWLMIEPGDRPAELRLNGHLLARLIPGTPARHDITARLAHRNELEVSLSPLRAPSYPAPPGPAAQGDRLLGDARLEIEPRSPAPTR
ncbi:MAG: hypothetical protein WDZ59_14595 [Pirellulales bacterium]